jgi:hypothetical protein
MRTACFGVALVFALLWLSPSNAQSTKYKPDLPTDTPALTKKPARPTRAVQPSPAQIPPPRPAYGIQNYSPLAASGGYRQKRQTFWEFWWHQFNPRNINYGAWIEQRRQVFLEQAAGNRYFWFSFWAFAAICFLLLWVAKERMDRKETEWEAAGCLADLANYADHCKQHALAAIQKHNEHIEVCNRVIESAEAGRPLPAGSGGADDWKAEMDRLSTELAQKTADNARLTAELEQKAATVNDLSARVDALARNQNARTDTGGIPSNMDLVARVNRLSGENQALRDENNRLKRANQHAGSGERVR